MYLSLKIVSVSIFWDFSWYSEHCLIESNVVIAKIPIREYVVISCFIFLFLR